MVTFKEYLNEQDKLEPDMKNWSFDDYVNNGFTPVVFAIGKFNPPHKGHYQVVRQLQNLSTKLSARPIVFVIDTGKRSIDSPLSGERRIRYLQKMFHEMTFEVATNAFTAFTSLIEKKLVPVGEVTGSDRSYVKDVGRIFGKSVSGHEKYESNPILRDETALGSSIVSASSSRMRKALISGNHELFKQLTGLPSEDADELFDEVKNAMGV